MQIAGTAYGIALNDVTERDTLRGRMAEKPYGAPPVAPVVYVKPRNCLQFGGAPVPLPSDMPQAIIGSTLAVQICRTVTRAGMDEAAKAVGAVSLAVDVSLPGADYYRPAIAEKCRDAFLPLGQAMPTPVDYQSQVVETWVDGEKAHEWSMSRLHRSVMDLIVDLSAFMTLDEGDVLLVGVAGDAPQAKAGSRICVRANGFPDLTFDLIVEDGL